MEMDEDGLDQVFGNLVIHVHTNGCLEPTMNVKVIVDRTADWAKNPQFFELIQFMYREAKLVDLTCIIMTSKHVIKIQEAN